MNTTGSSYFNTNLALARCGILGFAVRIKVTNNYDHDGKNAVVQKRRRQVSTKGQGDESQLPGSPLHNRYQVDTRTS
jgi:hypothetical protein